MIKVIALRLSGTLCFLLLFLTNCDKQEKALLFTRLASSETQLSFANDLKESEDLNIVQYLYAHNGGGVAIGDINNDGLPDIYFSANQLPNSLYLNKGDLVFQDITESAGVAGPSGPNSWSTGVTMADVNGDGHLDIYLSVVGDYKQLQGHNRLFINNADLTFTEASQTFGLDVKGFCQQAYFFDYDLDGDLDMYQLRHAVHKSEVYARASTRNIRDSLSGDLLFENENNKFKDVSERSGIYGGAAGYGLAAGIADLDNNGCPDIYISNDFHENDFLYLNNCDGTFVENATRSMGHTSRFSMGNDIADLNNDGLLDVFTADMRPMDESIRKKSAPEAPFDIYDFRNGFGYQDQYSRNMLQLNRGQLFDKGVQFSEIGQQINIQATDWSWGPLIVDLDNDGWKDLFITNGIKHRPNDLDYINFAYNDYAKSLSNLELADNMPDGAVRNFVYKNKGDLEFDDVSKEWGLDQYGYSMGSSYADLDNDGDLDIVVNNLNEAAAIYKNNSQELFGNNYLKIKLIGPDKNRWGIGAKIKIISEDIDQTLEVNPTRGWLSSVDFPMHFGLGKNRGISSLHITWPDGKIQELNDVPINRTLVLNHENSLNVPKEREEHDKIFAKTDLGTIEFVHQESEYTDFQFERLLLRKLSTEGPKISVGDVNGDGLDDFYIGGAALQAGELYIQNSKAANGFEKRETKPFLADGHHEDTDSVFFDFEGDGDQDLYVVSGGGESHGANEKRSDRIYLNDGEGNFERFKTDEKLSSNGAVVVAKDFDKDGHIDIFVGARSVIGGYGIIPKSTILWNHGNGKLLPDNKVDALLDLGMVTDAVFLEDSKELFVVGEWMPITIVTFKDRNPSIARMENSSGWWNTIHVKDMDGDGDQDLIAGNQGTNSGFKPTPQEPLGLYVNDFDQNGSSDPIFTYSKQGKEWIYQDLDELKGQMISIRKQFRNYDDFAKKTADQIITAPMRKGMVYHKAEMLESVYIENLGEGSYAMKSLPKEAQRAPIFGIEAGDFDGDGTIDIVAVGNFFSHPPSIGRADASYGNFLKGDGQGNFEDIEPRDSGWAISGEARDVKLLRTEKEHPFLLVARNNNAPLLFKLVESRTNQK